MLKPRKKLHHTTPLNSSVLRDRWRSGWINLVVLALVCVVVNGCGKSNSDLDRSDAFVQEERIVSSTTNTSPATQPPIEALPPAKKETKIQIAIDSEESKDLVRDNPSVSYRLPKLRVAPSDEQLKQHGLRKIESKRLIIITDSDNSELNRLPSLADQLFEDLQDWFGELPPAADGSDFQVLGHVMIDRAKFRAANLLPDESFTILHGRHRRYAFWAGYPDSEYYRRHLALHEFVHCFMTCEREDFGVPSPWYLEGMAELFGTHSINDKTNDDLQAPSKLQASFAVMPDRAEGFEGWGRIRAFRESFAVADHQQMSELNVPTFKQVVPDTVAVFESPFQYSSSWAICWFLMNHPDAPNLMPALAKRRTYSGFVTEWERQRNEFGNRLKVDWLLFSEQLDFGFDAQTCFPVHDSTGFQQSPSGTKTMQLVAKRGWQDTGIDVGIGAIVSVTADGMCVLNQTTEPWESSPAGISIEYYRGHRVGQVLAVLVSQDGKQITDRIAIGKEANLTAAFGGRIWLQVNDACNSRDNNTGQYQVQLEWAQQ